MMNKLGNKFYFIIGFFADIVVAAIAVLYAAQFASPLWVREEDLGRIFALEQQARSAYKKENIEMALAKISVAAEFRKMTYSAEKENQWPFTFPSIAIDLSLLPGGREGFMKNHQPDNIQLLYECSKVYLLNKNSEKQVNDVIEKIKINFPKVSKEWCLNIAPAFLNGV
ncbi:MAG: hypothetical protein LBH10_01825 [Burkholderiaceae bacterium]|jgi:hypothetical protein|nr:hypothetical protein [Burkholderiaceae bacterium]